MSEKSIHLLARTIRGIEWVAAAELEKSFKAKNINILHREVRFRLSRLERELLSAGSVDDIFLICKLIKGIDHTRASLPILAQRSSEIDFLQAINSLRHIRAIPKQPKFDTIASFLGRRNYNRYEIEDAVGEAIRDKTGWQYIPQRGDSPAAPDLSFRVHLSGNESVIGLRLTKTPLHRRAYKITSRAGTLHPPLAFAMAMLSSLRDKEFILDPFCGVGTIPIESLRAEPNICSLGVDIDNDNIFKAKTNAKAANKNVRFLVGDAGQLPFSVGTIDRVISNPPWGVTVGAQGKLIDNMLPFYKEIKRVLSPAGRITLLINSVTDHLSLIERSGLRLLLQIPISLFGSWPEICLLVNSSNRDFSPIDLDSAFGLQLLNYWRQWPALQQKISLHP